MKKLILCEAILISVLYTTRLFADTKPECTTIYNEISQLTSKGKCEQALALFDSKIKSCEEQIITENDEHQGLQEYQFPTALLNLGSCYDKLKQKDKALSLYKRGLTLKAVSMPSNYWTFHHDLEVSIETMITPHTKKCVSKMEFENRIKQFVKFKDISVLEEILTLPFAAGCADGDCDILFSYTKKQIIDSIKNPKTKLEYTEEHKELWRNCRNIKGWQAPLKSGKTYQFCYSTPTDPNNGKELTPNCVYWSAFGENEK